MPKTIFYRVFVTVQAILLFSMLCIGVFSFTFLGQYVIESKAATLKENANQISEMAALSLDSVGEDGDRFVKFSMSAVSNFSQCAVSIVNTSGEVYYEERYAKNNVSAHNLSIERMNDVLSGKKTEYIGRMEKMGNQMVLLISSPIVYKGTNAGAVVIVVPVPQLQKARHEIMAVLVWVYFLSMILASVISFFLARRIVKPIRQLNRAAKQIADGDFKMRVDEDAAGEVGELTRTFNAMTESLENLENMRSSFISNVSHELRTPMTTISGFVEGILDGTIPPEKHKEYMQIVLAESHRLSKLVSNLLVSSRVEQGLKLDMKSFDYTESLRVGIIQFESALSEKNIRVSVNFEEDPMMATGDTDTIRQVITNLLDNAAKFTPKGGWLDITVKKKNGKIITEITNSGDGIEPENLKRIWERFYKTDRSRSEDKNGVGLGLSLVKNILKQHGQTIEAESVPGEYTRFIFTLEAAD